MNTVSDIILRPGATNPKDITLYTAFAADDVLSEISRLITFALTLVQTIRLAREIRKAQSVLDSSGRQEVAIEHRFQLLQLEIVRAL